MTTQDEGIELSSAERML